MTANDENKYVTLKNENLQYLQSDNLYHLGIRVEDTSDPKDVVNQFGDVQYFLMGATKRRMYTLAMLLRKLDLPGDNKEELVNLSKKDYFAMFKVGPVLCCSHGVGYPSISILLNELLKLAKYARCIDPTFIRLGTCDGLGVGPGTVVITDRVFNGLLKRELEMDILGERVTRRTYLDTKLSKKILSCANWNDNFLTIRANTLSCNGFYEGQGRLDGALCEYTHAEKKQFMQKCYKDYGIRNIEMESMFSAITNAVGVRAANVSVTVIDRQNNDQICIPPEKLELFEQYPLILVARYIHCKLKSLKIDKTIPCKK